MVKNPIFYADFRSGGFQIWRNNFKEVHQKKS
jgi:hypothetical protein